MRYRNLRLKTGAIVACVVVAVGVLSVMQVSAADPDANAADKEKLERGEAVARAREKMAIEFAGAFNGPVDVFLIAKGADQPVLTNVRIIMEKHVGEHSYYLARSMDGVSYNIPPEQILMTRTSK